MVPLRIAFAPTSADWVAKNATTHVSRIVRRCESGHCEWASVRFLGTAAWRARQHSLFVVR